MAETPQHAVPAQRAGRKWRYFFILFVALIGYYGVICVRVANEHGRNEARRADAIIVFGAAEYAGRPSPILKARLDHAYNLYQQGLAPFIIVTGGAGGDPKFTEGGVGRDYLLERGVLESRVIAETQGSNTAQEAERAATIMRTNGMHTCLTVSDWYHMFRAKAALRREGMEPYSAPRPEAHRESREQHILEIMREAASYIFWQLHLS